MSNGPIQKGGEKNGWSSVSIKTRIETVTGRVERGVVKGWSSVSIKTRIETYLSGFILLNTISLK